MIKFNNQEIKFSLKNKTILKQWIIKTVDKKKSQVGELNFIFCSDDYLLKVNQEYLNHNTYTDIITFDYTNDKIISGDIFISVNRVEENAKKFSKSFENELHRVMIHGVLHLLGYKDKTKKAKEEMTKEEDRCLKSLSRKLV
jgi:probable rRNA maturation factor